MSDIEGIFIRDLFGTYIPVYVNYVYPFVPQHMGGGATPEIKLVTDDAEVIKVIDSKTTLLIDRSSSGVALLIVDPISKTLSTLELSSSNIKGIQFISHP